MRRVSLYLLGRIGKCESPVVPGPSESSEPGTHDYGRIHSWPCSWVPGSPLSGAPERPLMTPRPAVASLAMARALLGRRRQSGRRSRSFSLHSAAGPAPSLDAGSRVPVLNAEEWTALALSLKVALWATALSLPLGIWVAYTLARKSFWGKALLDGLVLL